MTTLFHSETKEHWDNEIAKIEEKSFTAKEAKQHFADGKLKTGELFILTDGFFPNAPEREAWVVGTFIQVEGNGKFIYVRHSADDQRLPRLKRMAVAHLIDTVKRGFVDTRQAPWLPARRQSIQDPSIVLHGAKSDSDIDDAGAFKETKQVFEGLQDINQI